MLIILLLSLNFTWGLNNLQNGDIVFQKSQSRQSKAIQEATDSPWTHMGIIFNKDNRWLVYEAVQPVSVTTLERFQERSKDRHIVIKRIQKQFIDLSTNENQRRLYEELIKFYGLNYDFLFQWSDESIYCSELIWKGIFNAFNKSLGRVERFKDMNLSGPYVKQLIKERLEQTGKELDLNEKIITPISIMNSQHLETVYDSHANL
ncbi:MAG: hypothetical protein MK008_09670 [Bdellovibrionales bacterium]|nr:hypothetical protein [Bdellovibrionales bacterium]